MHLECTGQVAYLYSIRCYSLAHSRQTQVLIAMQRSENTAVPVVPKVRLVVSEVLLVAIRTSRDSLNSFSFAVFNSTTSVKDDCEHLAFRVLQHGRIDLCKATEAGRHSKQDPRCKACTLRLGRASELLLPLLQMAKNDELHMRGKLKAPQPAECLVAGRREGLEPSPATSRAGIVPEKGRGSVNRAPGVTSVTPIQAPM